MATPFQLRRAAQMLRTGGIAAYPTEAVYGLGCDPENPGAVLRLLAIKRRDWRKGLILIAADLEQLDRFILPLSDEQLATIGDSWPGPNTWVVPARPETPPWLTGERSTLAVRVTAHRDTIALCRAFGGPLVSTSANLSGLPPARKPLTIRRTLGPLVDTIVPGELGDRQAPSTIRDLRSGAILRG